MDKPVGPAEVRRRYGGDTPREPWVRLAAAVLSQAKEDYLAALQGRRPKALNTGYARTAGNCTLEALEAWVREDAGELLRDRQPETVLAAWRAEAKTVRTGYRPRRDGGYRRGDCGPAPGKGKKQ